jgi:CDP-glucose 4,6-dehydratase
MEGCQLDAYEGKKVLITGASGFKGGWLSIWLTELGARVVGYSLAPPSDPNMFEATRLEEKMAHVSGDVRDLQHLESVFEEHEPEVVFHLAAQPIVKRSYREPRLTFETNVMGTVNVVEAVRQTESAEAVIIVTSDKCYENRETDHGFKETDPMGGYDAYSASKGCAELAVSAYRNSFFHSRKRLRNVAIASARAGNVIGGGDWGEDRLVPDCIRALSTKSEILIRSPTAIRPWQHVLEPLSGYLLLGVKLCEDAERYSSAWNFGPSEIGGITVEAVVRRIVSIWGDGRYRVDSAKDSVHEAKLLRLDCNKARSLLGWKPTYSINEALEETVAWYKEYYERGSSSHMYDYTVEQIRRFSGRARFQFSRPRTGKLRMNDE